MTGGGALRGGTALRTAVLTVAAPVVAVLLAGALASIALYVSGINPGYAFRQMAIYGSDPDSIVDILNRSTYYYIAAVAVAVGFRMNLFNIGVEGQYRLAAVCAAFVGSTFSAPAPIQILVIIVVAAAVGGVYALIPAVMKVTRGVNEVIATIMLNYI
ncbi:MAG: ral nucleoside transport system permease protein, partial [Actinomycetota bacterium]|nr:ral nucleoside transport system permease protein [Actinomycetota bacterium]